MKKLSKVLINWPLGIIRDTDVAHTLSATDEARYSAVKRALKNKTLVRIRRGLYLISAKTKDSLVNDFMLSLYIYEPSFVSLESALSFHGWIPEAVYIITAVSPKRAQEFITPVGTFSYKRVPEKAFYLGVERIVSPTGTSFIAQPWRAIADHIYVNAKPWQNLEALEDDMRIDHEIIKQNGLTLLKELIRSYPSPRVKKMLKVFLDELIAQKKR